MLKASFCTENLSWNWRHKTDIIQLAEKEKQVNSMNAKRGYVPEDERNFSPEAVKKMKIASQKVPGTIKNP